MNLNGLPKDGRIEAETLPPKGVADHRKRGGASGTVDVGRKDPPDGCLDVQRGKEISTDQPDAGGFTLVRRAGRRVVDLHLQPRNAAVRRENAGKDVSMVMQVLEFRKSEKGT